MKEEDRDQPEIIVDLDKSDMVLNPQPITNLLMLPGGGLMKKQSSQFWKGQNLISKKVTNRGDDMPEYEVAPVVKDELPMRLEGVVYTEGPPRNSLGERHSPSCALQMQYTYNQREV